MKNDAAAGKKYVQFRLQAHNGCEVFVAGTFNNWNPDEFKMEFKDSEYTTSILLPIGRHEYKFVVNNVWCIDPQCADWAPDGFGSMNSVIVVVT